MTFSEDEIAVLIEALEAWVNKDAISGVMGSLLGTLVSGDEQKEKFAAQQAINDAKRDRDKQNRKERAILMQAKLISMKDRAFAEAVKP